MNIKELKDKLIDIYSLKVKSITPIKDNVFKVLCDDNNYILKEKQSVGLIEYELQLLNIISSYDIRSNEVVKTKTDTFYFTHNSKLFVLFTFLEGETVTDLFNHDNYMLLMKEYGMALAKLHKALKDCEHLVIYNKVNAYDTIFNWAVPVIKKNIPLNELKQIIDYIQKKEEQFNQLPNQLIHRDFHTSNVLIKDDYVNGFIDFEISVYSVRLYDVVYLLTAILSGCFNNIDLRLKWLELINPYITAYEQNNSLTNNEKQSIKLIMLINQLTFVAYYFDINNENMAKENLEIAKWIYQQNI